MEIELSASLWLGSAEDQEQSRDQGSCPCWKPICTRSGRRQGGFSSRSAATPRTLAPGEGLGTKAAEFSGFVE